MKHLTRAGALLALIVVALIALKVIPAPELWEQYGFHQSENNAAAWSSLPPLYADALSCGECHEDNFSRWQEGEHGTVNCENCHGPAQAHVDSGARLMIITTRGSCGLCHDELPSRPADFPQVDLDEHGGQAKCVTCHDPHVPGVAAPPQIPHTLEDRADCLLCHGQGGLKPFPDDHAGQSNDGCSNCHEGLD